MSRRLATFAFVLALGLLVPQAASAWTLTVATAGSGSGSVSGAGFDCDWDGASQSGDCTEVYAGTTTVGANAVPDGSVATWAGCDSVIRRLLLRREPEHRPHGHGHVHARLPR